jgi:hypothetical protein
VKSIVLFLLIITGCALDKAPVGPTAPKFIDNLDIMGIEIKRPSDDGRFESIPAKSEKFATPVTVTRGSCPHDRYGKDCLVWFLDGKIHTEVIPKGWTVILIKETTITIAK